MAGVNEAMDKLRDEMAAAKDGPAKRRPANPDSKEPSISDEELDNVLRRVVPANYGKIQIAKHFVSCSTLKRSSEFLREKYGIGGCCYTHSTRPIIYIDYGPKGMFIQDKDFKEITRFGWYFVAKHIRRMIEAGTYLSEEEQEHLEKMKRVRMRVASKRLLPYIGYDARLCPECGDLMEVVQNIVDPARGWYKRWRKCAGCGKTVTTIELIMLPGKTGKLWPAQVVVEMKEEAK